MNGKKKDFPNKWKYWKSIPPEMMVDIDAEQFMHQRIYNHIIGDDWAGCIRWTNVRTQKTQEKCYRRPGSFLNKIVALLQDEAELEIVFATPEVSDGFNNTTTMFFQ